MLRHLFKLIWKRKTRNLLLSAEILLAFVIVFCVSVVAVQNVRLYQRPLGFQYTDVWTVEFNPVDDELSRNGVDVYRQLHDTLAALPQVRGVAFSEHPTFDMSTMSTGANTLDKRIAVKTQILQVSDDFFAIHGMMLNAGRWFSAADDGQADTPVVINRRLAEQLFPGRPAIGQLYELEHAPEEKAERHRVVGVIEDFRPKGEFMEPVNMVLFRFNPVATHLDMRTLYVKVAPGTPRAFEAELNERLHQVRPKWSYTIKTSAEMRDSMFRLQLVPLKLLAVVAAFLLAMVAFGLFGVLWQNITQRIPEIGLRRALGASAGDIARQVVWEQLLLSSGAVLAGLVLLAQLPLTGAFESLDWTVFGAAAALSAGAIYLLSLLCSLYPGWRAARLNPTAALHHE